MKTKTSNEQIVVVKREGEYTGRYARWGQVDQAYGSEMMDLPAGTYIAKGTTFYVGLKQDAGRIGPSAKHIYTDVTKAPAGKKCGSRLVGRPEFQRNGISGEPFYQALVKTPEGELLIATYTVSEAGKIDPTTCRALDPHDLGKAYRGDRIADDIAADVLKEYMEESNTRRTP